MIDDVIKYLSAALLPDETLFGKKNANELKELPPAAGKLEMPMHIWEAADSGTSARCGSGDADYRRIGAATGCVAMISR
jgi:hypothetical protein